MRYESVGYRFHRRSPRKEQGAPPEHAVGEVLIRAPIVGLFHSVEGLCEVGASVRAGQTVGAIESMKLLNDIVSDVSGEVIESMVEDGVPVHIEGNPDSLTRGTMCSKGLSSIQHIDNPYRIK